MAIDSPNVEANRRARHVRSHGTTARARPGWATGYASLVASLIFDAAEKPEHEVI